MGIGIMTFSVPTHFSSHAGTIQAWGQCGIVDGTPSYSGGGQKRTGLNTYRNTHFETFHPRLGGSPQRVEIRGDQCQDPQVTSNLLNIQPDVHCANFWWGSETATQYSRSARLF